MGLMVTLQIRLGLEHPIASVALGDLAQAEALVWRRFDHKASVGELVDLLASSPAYRRP